jgi:hypothetical protein
MNFFKIINKVLMGVLLLDGIASFIAVLLGHTHQWVIATLCCLAYFLMWYDNNATKNDDKKNGYAARRK